MRKNMWGRCRFCLELPGVGRAEEKGLTQACDGTGRSLDGARLDSSCLPFDVSSVYSHC